MYLIVLDEWNIIFCEGQVKSSFAEVILASIVKLMAAHNTPCSRVSWSCDVVLWWTNIVVPDLPTLPRIRSGLYGSGCSMGSQTRYFTISHHGGK